ncbi:MAG: hypothetical protein A3G25_18265 [Betaproteobacteria bacterium RIFCSPLOWO2_12_FULL_63_13]|nr:MAG: hypothetical protein A3H32_17235 [Betaproteobacteria bacterium RIFCSPLOWO2_02_FULL_63_19]OGA50053.1 MAG: hypothetical protein A3G25_18265 [Betaproteobacteria bacterium RIFCSPLOWO2_12_FULL_63_13]
MVSSGHVGTTFSVGDRPVELVLLLAVRGMVARRTGAGTTWFHRSRRSAPPSHACSSIRWRAQ